MATLEQLRLAESLMSAERYKEAIELLLRILSDPIDSQIMFRAILAFVEIPELIDVSVMKPICDRGIKIADNSNLVGESAYLKARKARNLALNIGMKQHLQRSLNLMPGWFAFALERERVEHEHLTQTIDALKEELGQLKPQLYEATSTLSGHKLQATLFKELGTIEANEALTLKQASIKHSRLFNLLVKCSLTKDLIYTRDTRRLYKKHVQTCHHNFVKAVRCCVDSSDEISKAFALYEHAIWMKTFEKFHLANTLLTEAKGIAQNNHIEQLLIKIPLVEKSIALKNSDIPNYVAGKNREEIARD